MKKIQLPKGWMSNLSDEFDCSRQTVYMALQYYFNSEKAQQIRKRAKEMLEEEAKNVVVEIEEQS